MKNRAKKLAAFLIPVFLFVSCQDEITNHYYQLPGTGSPPDVNVIYSSYALETVHSFHMDTTAYPEYNYSININLKLDEPGKRNQINKIIIVNESGFGWEFFSNQLENFYSSVLGGYELKNLIYREYSQYPQPRLYKVKLYSSSNVPSEDYEFFIMPDFIPAQYITHNWYTKDLYQVIFDYYYSPFNTTGLGEVVWLNQNKQYISKTDFSSPDIENGRYLRIGDVPNNAYYFYIYFNGNKKGITASFKSAVFTIEERFPENIQILNEQIGNISTVKYIPEIQKILIMDRYSSILYIIDYNTLNLDNKISFTSRPYSMTYSAYDNKIYVGSENGRLYSANINETSPTLVKNFGTGYVYSLIVLNKFLVASTSNNSFRILNLETNSVQTETNSNYYSCNNLVFNKTLNVVYGNSQYYGITRFNFDPVSGAFSNYLQKYTGSSNDNELLLYPDDSKIIAPSGYIFNCSGNVQNDLTNYNYLGQGFISAYFSQDNNGIITLFSGGYSYLSSINIYSKDNLEIIGVKEDFWSTPVYMIVEGDVIKVLERNNYGIIAESFSYSDIISGGEMLNTIAKEKYYLPRKLNY